jgi:hypothetical protein
MKTLLTLLAAAALTSCASFEKNAGITLGQSLGLAADLVKGYEAAHAANKPSAKAVTDPTPVTSP